MWPLDELGFFAVRVPVQCSEHDAKPTRCSRLVSGSGMRGEVYI
jgi:hypothetical protein